MKSFKALLLIFILAACFLATVDSSGARAQEAAALQKIDAPPNGVWVDSLDLSRAPIRRPSAPRGAPRGTPPVPVNIVLGGVEYAHGVPIAANTGANGDINIDLHGGAVRF